MASHQESWSEEEVKRRLAIRRKARTDLYFLAKEILGYKDVDPEVHRPSLELPQKFEKYQGKDIVQNNGWCRYTPPHWDLHQVIAVSEPRDRLLLDPRSHLKTTINTIAHTIQIILNFPDCCILIMHASEGKSIEIMSEIQEHFKHNEVFRSFFPEFCPQGKVGVSKFGSSEKFTVPCRVENRRHPTVSSGSMTKKLASSHYDWIKYSDVVDETTVTTPEQIQKTKSTFAMQKHLRVGPLSFRDIEGTIYDEMDLYCHLLDTRYYGRIARGKKPNIAVSIRGAYRKDVPGGQTFQPEERHAPYLVAQEDITYPSGAVVKKGEKIPWWIEKAGKPHFTPEELEDQRADDPWIFACQMLLNPAASGASKPFDPGRISWVTSRSLARIPAAGVICTIDTASTVNKRSNDSAITTAIHTATGDVVVKDIVFGKWQPSDLLDVMFEVYEKHRPNFMDIEETEFVRGLMSSLRMHEQKRGYSLPIRYLPRETDISKVERIMNALQPPFRAGRIKFAETLPEHVQDRLRSEMSKFPSAGGHDDILDTLADQYFFKDHVWAGPEVHETAGDIMKRAERHMLHQQTLNEILEESLYETSITGSL